MNHAKRYFTAAVICFMLLLLAGWAPGNKAKKLSSTGPTKPAAPTASANDQLTNTNMQEMLDQGRQTFRYDTFGDQAFWGGALHLQQAIAGEKLGGIGPGVSPKTALSVGLKVDADALPASWWNRSKPAR